MTGRWIMTALLLMFILGGPIIAAPVTDVDRLNELSRQFAGQLDSRRPQKYYELLESKDLPQLRLNENPDIKLMYIDDNGHPVYFAVDNLNAARTISTDDVWPGGGAGFLINGSGTLLGELCIWDGGGVLLTHRELTGRVAQIDSPSGTHSHSTHVAGTMIATGVSASAKGMSFLGTLHAYDFDNDESEMASAAGSGARVSNHSYSRITGWYLNGDWYWYGDITISHAEDYGFGFYGETAQDWDAIAYNAPYYTIVKSAGNDRDDVGPGPGGGHYVLYNGNWTWVTTTRDPDGGDTGYDCIGWYGTAKNIMTVGAVYDITGGYSEPSDVIITSFSSWGPCDDGRIKPDIVANGASLYSCTNGSDASYGYISGTSMSAPNVSGSINLLRDYYEQTHSNQAPLSSTMKALVIQTADEAGTDPGPDYKFGWGLMNTLKAAQVIQADFYDPGYIIEDDSDNDETDVWNVYSDGTTPLRVTLVWTDRPGTPPAEALDPPTPMLVNDLDLRLEHIVNSTLHYPYLLDPDNPGNAATTGDNTVDNVEQVHIESPAEGAYKVIITNKGSMMSAQSFSLVSSSKMVACIDSDGDGFGDPGQQEDVCLLDNCPDDYNPDQLDSNGNGIGDVCDHTCGDFNDDEVINILDIVFLINYVYKSGTAPEPLTSADVNSDEDINILDIVYLISYVYKNGPEPDCP